MMTFFLETGRIIGCKIIGGLQTSFTRMNALQAIQLVARDPRPDVVGLNIRSACTSCILYR